MWSAAAGLASLQIIDAENDGGLGSCVAVLAMATPASMGGHKIWGFAVALERRVADESPATALPDASREGRPADGPVPGDCDLPRLGERALGQPISRNSRHGGGNRAEEFGTLRFARRINLDAQHFQRLDSIDHSISTSVARRGGERSDDLPRSQLRQRQERHDRPIAELEGRPTPEIGRKPVVECALHVNPWRGA